MNQLGIFDITARKHKGNAASKAANPKAQAKKESHEKILELLRMNGRLTAKEISILLGKPFNAISGRFSELKMLGKIRGTGVRKEGSELLEVAA